MSSADIFNSRAIEYDRWYDEHRLVYLSELKAVEKFECKRGVEIGVGTGRFARGGAILVGVDPSINMLKLAPKNVHLIQGVGEALPLRSKAFDCAFIIVTLCFVDDPIQVLRESIRVSEKVITCIIPRRSPWGRRYESLGKRGHAIYSKAKFYSVKNVIDIASEIGLRPAKIIATMSREPGKGEFIEEVRHVSAEEAENYGFVCIEFVPEK